MSIAKLNFFYFLTSLYLLHLTINMRIHILRNPIEIPKRKGEKDINKMPDSKLSKLCKSILNTGDNLGHNPFQIYEYCKEKYEFFGGNDQIILIDSPFCFYNLEKFFCNFRIIDDIDPKGENGITLDLDNEDSDSPLTDNSRPCVYEGLTGLVLSAIEGCLKDDKNLMEKASNNFEFKNPIKQNRTNNEGNICPSLNYENYKIENKIEFCNKAQKKQAIPLENGGQDFDYLMIKDNEQISCGKVVDMYNLCIDTDYILYPNSNYQRCFNKLDSIYSCNIVKTYKDQYFKDMCSNYVLPVMSKDYNNGKIKDTKEYCFNFNDKITQDYENEITISQNLVESNLNLIKNLNSMKDNISDLSKNALHTLNNTSTLSSKWMKFFPLFSLTFKLRPNITTTELFQLNKMRETFDQSFKFLADLDRMNKDPQIRNANFSEKMISYKENLLKIDSFFAIIGDISDVFGQLLDSNKNITIDKNSPDLTHQYVEGDYVSKEELLSFQNEFVEMIQYSKNYMNFIMRRIKEEGIQNNDLVLKTQQNLLEANNRRNLLEQKKNNLVYDLLKE